MTTDPLHNPALRAPGPLRRLWQRFTDTARPLRHIQVEVTSHCPGACIYCPRAVHADTWRARHMSDATFAAIWPLMLRSDRVHLQGWGEPLLHPRFLDFVALASKAGCAVSSTSCGLRMDAPLADAIVRSGMDILAFSLVGTDEESNDARRRVPFGRVLHAFEIMREAIRMNGGRGPRLHIAYLLLADRIEAARALPALMRALDIPSCVVSTLDMPVLPAHARLAFAPHEREKIHRARCLLEDIAAEAARDGRSIRYGLPQPHPRHGCRENVHESVYVDADGDVSPCIYVNVPDGMPRATPNPWVFGNVNSEDAAAIWDKLPFADFRADVRNDAPPPPCERCPKRYEEFV